MPSELLAIEVDSLSKVYRKGVSRATRITERRSRDKGADGEFWALKDVSFGVERGQVLGLIGRNGAGKSTLLRILARITLPTSGEARIRGRVASLLEVGTGFHQELTGRENVLLSAAILGMSRKEIQSRMGEIVEFSGIGEFIDTPVKRYSSGMYVRLGFAVAAHIDADVLLVDEVLAVGDAEFRKRCLGRIDDITKSGRTVLLVSHDMSTINQICSAVVWLHDGSSLATGSPTSVIEEYMGRMAGGSPQANIERRPGEEFWYGSIQVTGADGRFVEHASCDEPLSIRGSIEFASVPNDLYGTVYVSNRDGTIALFTDWRDLQPDLTSSLGSGTYEFEISLPPRLLAPGDYTITADLATVSGGRLVHNPEIISFGLTDLESIRGNHRPGSIGTLLPWRVKPKERL